MTHGEPTAELPPAHNVRRVAIVDDGYDPPMLEAMAPSSVRAFRVRVRDALEDGDPDDVGSACARHGFGSLQDVLDGLDDPERLGQLWAIYLATGRDGALGAMLHVLFSSYAVDRNDKLAPLQRLEGLVEQALGLRPATFGAKAEPRDLFGYDLIFLDYYLEEPAAPEAERAGTRVTSTEAREHSIAFLRELVSLSPTRLPLVMLISSEATAEDIPEFRRHAKVLASSLQFLPKNKIEADRLQAEAVLSGLVERRVEVDALWELLALWQTAVRVASDGLLDAVRELDLPDYGYLQDYRLTSERIPLAHYLVWLFNGHLSSLVEATMSGAPIAKVVGDLVARGSLPGRVAPTEAISQLYGSITTSYVPIHLEGFSPKAWAGDVFVRTDKWHDIGGDPAAPLAPPFDQPMPEVVAVVTPACDLVPERSGKLGALTTVGGTLEPVLSVKEPTTHFLVVRGRQFHVSWNPKWPVTVPMGAADGTSLLGGRYRWVGRLRDIYHADLQHMLASELGRVGLPVVPTMPQWSAVRVLAKVGGKFVEVLSKPAADRAVWTVFSARKGGEKVLQLREDLAWDVRARVLGLLGEAADKQSAKLREVVDSLGFVHKLQHPMALKKDAHSDAPTEIHVRRGSPDVGADVGANCDRMVLVVFGDDVATTSGSARADGAGRTGRAPAPLEELGSSRASPPSASPPAGADPSGEG